MPTFNELAEAWANHCQARAHGGHWALEGFSFQFHESLFQFFEPVASGRPPEDAAFDCLSDFSTKKDGRIYVTQHKLTLRGDSYRKSLKEFLAFDSFLATHFPETRQTVIYRIAASKTEKINLAKLPLLGDQASAEKWGEIESSGRFAAIAVDANPWRELLRLLWPLVQHPSKLIDQCVALLFNQIASDEFPRALYKQLVDAFEAEKYADAKKISGQILTPQDFSVSAENSSDVLIGARPQLDNWRGGCFMPRPTYVNQIHKKLTAITLRAEGNSARRKVPILWITGDPGLGKSVLLLATLERLAMEKNCLLIRDGPEALCEALRKTKDMDIVIGIDDLYAPHQRNEVLWDSICSLARDRGTKLMLVASSANDYKYAFTQHPSFSDVFEGHETQVKPLIAEEPAEYVNWYNRRRGTNFTDVAVSGNFMLATFNLQLREGGEPSLTAFAARLWALFEDKKIVAPIAVALAANRLGLIVPAALFDTPLMRAGLANLRESQLLLLRDVVDVNGVSVKQVWAHRVLADELYKQRYGEDKCHERASHLMDYWDRLADNERHTLIATAGKTGRRTIENIPNSLAHEFLLQLAKKMQGDWLAQRPQLWLAGWKECADARELPVAEQKAYLGWLITWLCERLDGKHTDHDDASMGDVYRICSVMLPSSRESQLQTAMCGWLTRAMDQPFWGHVWLSIWAKTSNTSDQVTLLELAREWLSHRAKHVGWMYVFLRISNEAPTTDWLPAVAETALPTVSGIAGKEVEQAVMLAVDQLVEGSQRFALIWCTRLVRHCKPELSKLAKEQLKRRGARFGIECLEEIVSKYPNEVGAGFALQVVLDDLNESGSVDDETSIRLHRSSNRWLTGRENEPAWAHVWQRLLFALPHGTEKTSVLLTGHQWLKSPAHEDAIEWPHVWQKMYVSLNDQTELVDLGISWLSKLRHLQEWARVWQTIVKYQQLNRGELAPLVQMSLDWLPGHENWPEWTRVWQDLLHCSLSVEQKANVLETGMTWLTGHEHMNEWAWVWLRLCEQSWSHAEQQILHGKGKDWLRTHQSHTKANEIKSKLAANNARRKPRS